MCTLIRSVVCLAILLVAGHYIETSKEEVQMAGNGQKSNGKNKKRGLSGEDSRDTSKQAKGATCPICSNVVREAQQVIYCEGSCNQWMHRQCASLTTEAFIKAGESNQPFYCLYCTVASHKQQINILKEQVKSLTTKIDSLSTASFPTENIDTPNAKKV